MKSPRKKAACCVTHRRSIALALRAPVHACSHPQYEFKRTSPTRDAKACLEAAIEQIRSKRYGIGSFPSHALYRVAMVIASEEKAILPAFCQEVV